MKFCISILFILFNFCTEAENFKLQAPEYNFSTGENYYRSPVYFGGNIGFYPSKNGYIATFNPIIGARIARRFHLGTSIGFQYYHDQIEIYKGFNDSTSYSYQAANYDLSIFARYFIVYRFFFQLEPGIVNQKTAQLYWDASKNKVVEEAKRINTPTVLGGLGFAQPIGEQSILVLTLLYDFYQHENSPYGKLPFLRGGFNLGF